MANGEFTSRTGVRCRYCDEPLSLGSICDCTRSQHWFNTIGREVFAAPKPATAEPPEWKGPPQSWLEAKREVDEGWADDPPEPCLLCKKSAATYGDDYCNPCSTQIAKNLQAGADLIERLYRKPEPTPLDRALSDFIERRKAKRVEAAAKFLYENAHATDRSGSDGGEGWEIARAMLTPITFTARMGGR